MMEIIKKIILLLALTYPLTCHEDMTTLLQKCLCKGNKKYGNITTVCRPLNRTSKWFTFDVYFHPGVVLEAPIYLEVNAYKKFTTVYRPFMIKLKDELCGQLLRKDHIFFKLAGFNYAESIGNLLEPCPFKGHRYSIPTITHFDYFLFPSLPVGEWRFDFILSKNINGSDEFIGSWSSFYEIKPKGAKEF